MCVGPESNLLTKYDSSSCLKTYIINININPAFNSRFERLIIIVIVFLPVCFECVDPASARTHGHRPKQEVKLLK